MATKKKIKQIGAEVIPGTEAKIGDELLKDGWTEKNFDPKAAKPGGPLWGLRTPDRFDACYLAAQRKGLAVACAGLGWIPDRITKLWRGEAKARQHGSIRRTTLAHILRRYKFTEHNGVAAVNAPAVFGDGSGLHSPSVQDFDKGDTAISVHNADLLYALIAGEKGFLGESIQWELENEVFRLTGFGVVPRKELWLGANKL
jgi:hypothetical protein